jgi:hypothetical protein
MIFDQAVVKLSNIHWELGRKKYRIWSLDEVPVIHLSR